MKCQFCKHKKHHLPDTTVSIIEYEGDPHDYEYCEEGNWDESYTEPTSQKQFEQQQLHPDVDFWADCEKFVTKKV